MCWWHFKRREVNRLQGKVGNYKQVNRGTELDAKHNACLLYTLSYFSVMDIVILVWQYKKNTVF